MSWTHDLVFRALRARGERYEKLKKNRYVTLYQPQPKGGNCAILYSSDSTSYMVNSPVHLHGQSLDEGPARKHWQDAVFRRIKPFLRRVRRDHKNNPTQGFCHYAVQEHDWDGFALAIGLPKSP